MFVIFINGNDIYISILLKLKDSHTIPAFFINIDYRNWITSFDLYFHNSFLLVHLVA